LVSVDEEMLEKVKAEYKWEKEKDGIKLFYKQSTFILNDYCPYYKTLAIIGGSKCMLDVPIGSQSGSTIRLQEAITYGKKLITNLREVKDKPYYIEQNFMIFDKVEDIDLDFIDQPKVDNPYNFSPLKMIEYAKTKLKIK